MHCMVFWGAVARYTHLCPRAETVQQIAGATVLRLRDAIEKIIGERIDRIHQPPPANYRIVHGISDYD